MLFPRSIVLFFKILAVASALFLFAYVFHARRIFAPIARKLLLTLTLLGPRLL